MSQNRFTYDENKVKSVAVDGYYLWIAYQGSDGTTIIAKVSGNDPSQIYYELSLSVDNIVRLKVSGNYIYAIVEDDDYIAVRITTNNPLGSEVYYDKPVGETEDPVNLCISNYLYILIPGSASGQYAKIYKFDKAGTALDETITLNIGGNSLRNANCIDIDTSSEELVIATNESPLVVGRLTPVSGGTWNLDVWTLE